MRLPTADELKIVETLGQMQFVRPPAPKGAKQPPGKNVFVRRREDWTDLVWALINSTEFLYRH